MATAAAANLVSVTRGVTAGPSDWRERVWLLSRIPIFVVAVASYRLLSSQFWRLCMC